MTHEVAQPGFDYATLAPDAAAEVRWHADKIRHRTAAAIIENGRDLIAVKAMPCMEGRFVAWLRAEFNLSKSTAYNMMQVAENLGDRFTNFGNVSPSVLYQLAVPSTPDEVRDEVEARAEAGEKIPLAEVERLKREAARQKQRADQFEADLRVAREMDTARAERAHDEAQRLRKEANEALDRARAEMRAEAEQMAEEELRKKGAELDRLEAIARRQQEIVQESEQRLSELREQHQMLSSAQRAEREHKKAIRALNESLMVAVTDIKAFDVAEFTASTVSQAKDAAQNCRQMAEFLDTYFSDRLQYE